MRMEYGNSADHIQRVNSGQTKVLTGSTWTRLRRSRRAAASDYNGVVPVIRPIGT